MSRLTNATPLGIVPTASNDELLAKLYKYEETGLEPEEINKIVEDNERTNELLKNFLIAHEEDRLIILPVKPHQDIYFDGRHFAPHCAGQLWESDQWYYTYPMITKDFHGEIDYEFWPDDIGITYFTDRESCVQFLCKEYNRDPSYYAETEAEENEDEDY